MKIDDRSRSFRDTGIALLVMLCYAHASSLNSWAPDPVESVASSPVTSPPVPTPPDSANSIRSFRGRRLGTAGSPHKSQQSPWTIIPAKSRNMTSTSATAVIRRKNSRDNNFRPVNATRALTGSKQDPDDALVNGEFVSKKVIVALSCEPEETVVKFNFTSPFRGVIQAGGSQSPCRIKGDGRKYYSLAVPHNSCGTKHVSSTGSFFNTLFIRYHPSLEMEGDQLKSIVCKFGTGSFSVG